MKTIKRTISMLCLLMVMHLSAQNTEPVVNSGKVAAIEQFQLPSFKELSSTLTIDYGNLYESLPDLSNIGSFVQKEISKFNEGNLMYTFRNFGNDLTLLPNINTQKFELRNNLNNIMFNGFDVNLLHCNEAWRGGQ